jgi:hypothetical protein
MGKSSKKYIKQGFAGRHGLTRDMKAQVIAQRVAVFSLRSARYKRAVVRLKDELPPRINWQRAYNHAHKMQTKHLKRQRAEGF